MHGGGPGSRASYVVVVLPLVLALALVAAVVAHGWDLLAPPARLDLDHRLEGSSSPAAPGGAGHEDPQDNGPSQAELLALLDRVSVVPERPQVPGYDRDCGPGDGCVFGTEWSDDTDAPMGHNGCDTRNDVLRSQLSDVVTSEESEGCDVVGGSLTDPYTGRVMDYATEGSEIHVDHLVPLAAAWDMGAWGWPADRRTTFANDVELELVAVEGSANMSKGDSTPASWLPPAKSYRCTYLTDYLEVSLAYSLPITRADAEVISHAARRC